MGKILTLVFGFVLYYLISLLLVWLFVTGFVKLSKKVKIDKRKINKATAVLALISFVSTFLVLIIYSVNIYIYSFFYFVLAAGVGFLYLERVEKISKIDSALIVVGLGVVLNPVWLRFIGIL